MTRKYPLLKILIPAIVLIIVAMIQFYPWKRKELPLKLNNKTYYLTGTVVDEFNNNSIGGADLTIVGRNEHYFTEQNGNFSIPLIDSVASIRIRVYKKNYKIFDQSVDIPVNNYIIPLSSSMK